MKKDYSKVREIIAYIVVGLIWLGGLAICILGVYAFNGPGKLANNPIYQAQKNFTTFLGWKNMIDFRVLGSIICLLAMCLFLIFIYHYANKVDKRNSRKSRQLEKLKKLIEANDNLNATNTIDATNVSNEANNK